MYAAFALWVGFKVLRSAGRAGLGGALLSGAWLLLGLSALMYVAEWTGGPRLGSPALIGSSLWALGATVGLMSNAYDAFL